MGRAVDDMAAEHPPSGVASDAIRRERHPPASPAAKDAADAARHIARYKDAADAARHIARHKDASRAAAADPATEAW
jgi:hypothetical protein